MNGKTTNGNISKGKVGGARRGKGKAGEGGKNGTDGANGGKMSKRYGRTFFFPRFVSPVTEHEAQATTNTTTTILKSVFGLEQ